VIPREGVESFAAISSESFRVSGDPERGS